MSVAAGDALAPWIGAAFVATWNAANTIHAALEIIDTHLVSKTCQLGFKRFQFRRRFHRGGTIEIDVSGLGADLGHRQLPVDKAADCLRDIADNLPSAG